MSDEFRPLARADGLLVDHAPDGLLVLDTRENQAHVLNSPASKVWRLCDGKHDLRELGELSGLDRMEIRAAVTQLEERGLLTARRLRGVSRRDMLRGGAAAGAVGLGVPLIRSIVAPPEAEAATTAQDAGATVITESSSFTADPSMCGEIVECNSSSATTVTIATASNAGWTDGTANLLQFVQAGTGQVTIVAGSGVTLLAPNGANTAKQWSIVSLYKRAGVDTWVVAGDTTF